MLLRTARLLSLALLLGFTACGTRSVQSPAADRSSSPQPSAIMTLYPGTGDRAQNDNWYVEDDRVMGGRSQGHVEMTAGGHGRFHGQVSLENNGGFSSVQYDLPENVTLDQASAFRLRLKGDGKRYNFRVKPAGQRYSYTYEFPTSGEWEEVTVPFDQLRPTFRGRTPDAPPYTGQTIEQIRYLIGNKKAQDFELLFDWVQTAE